MDNTINQHLRIYLYVSVGVYAILVFIILFLIWNPSNDFVRIITKYLDLEIGKTKYYFPFTVGHLVLTVLIGNLFGCYQAYRKIKEKI